MRLDIVYDMGHNVGMKTCFMVQSKKFPRVFFRDERARFWADNTLDEYGKTCTEYVAQEAKRIEDNYLIVHPEDDEKDIPFDYSGQVIRFKSNQFGGPKAAN